MKLPFQIFHWKLLLLVVPMFCMLSTPSVFAQDDKDDIDDKSEQVIVAGDYEDMAFLAADNLVLSLTSSDDVFAAGGDLIISGASAEHLIAVGGEISANSFTIHDLILAGGEMTFTSGTVQDDIVLAGSEIKLGRSLIVGGSAVLAGNEIEIEAPIGGTLKAVAEEVDLLSNVVGDVELFAETIRIGAGVTIGGDLRYRAENLDMDSTAEVTGTIIKLASDDRPEIFESYGRKMIAFFAIASLVIIGGLLLATAVIAALFPGLLGRTERMMQMKPWQTLGVGALAVIAGPFLLALLMSTVIGIPLALVVGSFYLAAAPLAFAASSYYLGLTGRSLARRGATDSPDTMLGRVGWSLLGLITLIIVGLIPFLGALLWLVAFIFGMGAVIVQIGNHFVRPATLTPTLAQRNMG
jgi:hypothetical protein